MNAIDLEISAFRSERAARAEEARMRVALQLGCGIDLDAALAAPSAERQRLALALDRRVQRERLKGLARHWSYDLNRHIALKRAADRLRAQTQPTGGEGGIEPPCCPAMP
jgi:hypothetical protein